MRTNIEIDDALMARAMAAGDFKTKKEAVEEGLRLLARQKAYKDILALRGKLHWDISAASQPEWERAAIEERAAAKPAARRTVRRAVATRAKAAQTR